MVRRQIIPLLLLTVLHGEHCAGLFNAICNEKKIYQCGETMTTTCTLSHPLQEVDLKYNREHFLKIYVTEEGRAGKKEKERVLIEWTDDKVMVTISKVKFSDTLKYFLTLDARESKGNYNDYIDFEVHGICEPEITKNPKELECEAESEKNASIVWMDDHRKLYQATRTEKPEELNGGYKLRSSLKLTEDIEDNTKCCSVSYPIDGGYAQKQSCISDTPSGTVSKQVNERNPAITVFFALLAVAAVAAGFGYLFKKRNTIIIRETHEKDEKANNESLLTQTV
ncbi:uncharacterized protein [Dendropsophus ebraccatus]|uniref:uncharacterized protein isoform X2 n=1 Tax=Dendropsophus ebraccatus TaxID=150705 RepID=UPI003831737B